MNHYISCRTLWRKREDEKISFFFSFITDNDNFKWKQKIRPIELGFTESSRLVKRNRNRLCFLSQPPSKDASNDTEESDKNNEMG